MRKRFKVFISVSLIVALLLCSFCRFISCFIAKRGSSSLTVDKESGILSSNREEIQILLLSDLQFANYIEMAAAFSSVKKLIKDSKPDLILTTGDNFGNNVDRHHLSAFIRFMDSFDIPWGVTFGNHDYNADFTMEEYSEALKGAENSIFNSTVIADTYSNYSYRLNIQGKNVFSLIMMDTKKDGLTEEHTSWYEEQVSTERGEDGSLLPSLVFFHIPLPETVLANEAYLNDPSLGSGEIYDSLRVHKINSGIFDAALRLRSTKAFFYGHDHLNNAHIDYNGIKLCYSVKSSINVSFRKENLGGLLINIDKNGSFSIKRLLR